MCTYINLFSCSCIHLLIYLVIDVVILYMYLFYFLPGIYICIYIYTSIVKPQLNSPIDKMGMFLPQQMEDLLQNRWSIHGVTYIHFTQKMWMVASMECFEGTCAGRQWVVTIKEYQRLLLFPVNFLRPVFRDCWQLLIAAPLHQHFYETAKWAILLWSDFQRLCRPVFIHHIPSSWFLQGTTTDLRYPAKKYAYLNG